jgi:hypothetical protein
MVHGAPQVVPLAVNLHKHLVEVPTPAAGPLALNAPLAHLGREHRSEPVTPEPHGLVAHVDAALMQQVLDISKLERKPDVEHHCQADDPRTGLEIAEWTAFRHLKRLRWRPTRLKLVLL